MLLSLYIKNLAIINELNVSFENGLNIITGETGAGKSLIIKAIQLLLGKQFSPELLRTGSDKLVIEGVFIQGNTHTVIRRLYSENRQSKTFINDEPVKQKVLLKTTRLLADLHGQHDHQNLLDSNTHLKYLDSFGSYKSELKEVKQLFDNAVNCENKLNQLQSKQSELEEKSELFNFQLKELSLYPISSKFEKEMTIKYNLLSKASDIQSSLHNVSSLLEIGDSAVIKKLTNVVNELEKVSRYDESIQDIAKRAKSNRIDLEDLVIEIQRVQENIVINKDDLEKLNDIISYSEMLKRKYGGSMDAVVEYKDNIIKAERESGNYKTDINKLEKELRNLKKELSTCSEKISRKRRKIAILLESMIKQNLDHLNMPQTQFKINLTSNPDNILDTGMDLCEFFISTNVGEELRPVVKIASGGEISRIMLAIKMALQSKDIVNTLIFDEIDSGISGATAERVGDTFEKLAESHQILCITHLSQIAGKGNTHFKVSKKVNKHRSTADIYKLSNSERVREIAILISGQKVTESSQKQAVELLQLNG